MVSRQVTIQNRTGFHIRPAQLFVDKAGSFEALIKVRKDEVEVDGKSILGLMTLGLEQGTTIEIRAEGPDEQQAVESLIELVESKFGEE